MWDTGLGGKVVEINRENDILYINNIYTLYFSDYKTHFPPNLGGKGGVSYTPNVAYLARWGGGAAVEWVFVFTIFLL